jgi:hypothetical protein
MTGVKAPTGVLGASVVVAHAKGPLATTLGTHVTSRTLPFTGLALSVYLVLALMLIASGFVLRTLGNARR